MTPFDQDRFEQDVIAAEQRARDFEAAKAAVDALEAMERGRMSEVAEAMARFDLGQAPRT